MAFAAPQIDELFGGLPAEARLDRFESFKSALSACHQSTQIAAQNGSISFNGQSIVKTASVAERIADVRDSLTKTYSADQIADVTTALDRAADLQKDWSLTNPLNTTPFGPTGMVPYNLDPALALLVPRNFTLRNSTPRIGAVGQAYEFRRILGVSNSNTGGVANLNTFFATGVTDTFGAVSLNRPKKISYAADRIVLSHKQQGVSDSVDMQAQFAGMGFTDLRQLSHTSAIWSHMLGEERNMANARSTALVFGAGTPVAAVDATTLLTGLPAGAATVIITPVSSMGEGQGVAAGSITAVAGQGVKLTTVPAISQGTLGISFYVTITSGGAIYKGTTTRTDGASPTTFVLVGANPSTSADNGSYSANAYDGYVQTLSSSAAGYVKALNGSMSTSEPGAEFQDAFASLFNSVLGDPDVILTTAAIRRALAKNLQAGNNGYRLNFQTGSDGATIGSVVTAIQNESTGKMVDVIAHPYLPAGTALIHTRALPFPDSGVSETVQAVNVQDMLVIEWPQIQLGYDLSTYQYGTLAFRAPAWSGAITNIVA